MISHIQSWMGKSMLVVVCAAIHLVCAQASHADEENAVVQFRLLDEPSGEPVPAMVCIRNLEDNSVRLPPDGRVMEQVSRTEEFYRGVVFEPDNPGWIGPPRKMLGKGDNNDRSFVYDELSSIPFWREPVVY